MTELTTGDIVEATGLTVMQLHRWCDSGTIRPSIRPSSGTGRHRVWSVDDLHRLRAIAQVLDDLAELGIHHITRAFVARLWDCTASNEVVHGTVTIRLGLEDA